MLTKNKSVLNRVLRCIDFIVIGFILLTVLLLCALTWWLTPQRLSDIIDTKASTYLNADVSTGYVSFTLWSSFPHLRIQIDSIHVRSRNLDSLPRAVSKNLPDSADFLLSTGRASGGINLSRLLAGHIMLRDVKVDSLNLNLVAVSDSINNYDIVPPSGRRQIPYFHIDSLSFADGGTVRYRSLISDTKATVNLSGASLMPRKGADNYHLLFKGKVSAASGKLSLLHDFPFKLDGDLHLRFRPFGVSASDYQVALGSVNGKMGFDLDLGNQPTLTKFDYRLSDLSLSDLVSLLSFSSDPAQYPILRRLEADMQLDASAKLTSPYDFASGFLPSLEVDFSIPDCHISYLFSDNERYTADNVGMTAKLVFDGRQPNASYIDVSDFYARGIGADVHVIARVSDLTDNPKFDIKANGSYNFTLASRLIKPIRALGISGTADFDVSMGFTLVGNQLHGSVANADVKAQSLALKYGGYNLIVHDLHASTGGSYADGLSQQALLNDIPLGVDVSVGDARFSSTLDTVSLAASSLSAHADIGRYFASAGKAKSKSVLRKGRTMVRSRRVYANLNGFDTKLTNLAVSADASLLASPRKLPGNSHDAVWYADSADVRYIPHTPRFVTVALADKLKRLIASVSVNARLAFDNADFTLGRYPISVSKVSLAASNDSIILRNAHIRQDKSQGDLSAKADNIFQFLTSPVPSPIIVDANVRLDTLRVNHLARTYTDSHPESAIARGDKEAMAAGVDTVSILIPRNIRARINATAKQTRYINLRLNDLMTKIRIADGRAVVDTLHVGSDFGQATLKFVYDTSDIENLAMKAGLNIYDVDVVSFFQNFPKVLNMMPEMKNLSGTLSASVDGHVDIFPKMFVNVPSLWANAYVHGVNLKLRQNKFIRKVTRMLMIPDGGTLHIADILVHAGVHSNLLEVFPFTFEVSNYKLRLQGLNNFDGDLYYHIGVDRSPLKIPFGINIKGKYHHPILRFGDKEWKDKNGAIITGGVEDYDSLNLTRTFRRYFGEFIHTAAVYPTTD